MEIHATLGLLLLYIGHIQDHRLLKLLLNQYDLPKNAQLGMLESKDYLLTKIGHIK
jgi:hypothetical protein